MPDSDWDQVPKQSDIMICTVTSHGHGGSGPGPERVREGPGGGRHPQWPGARPGAGGAGGDGPGRLVTVTGAPPAPGAGQSPLLVPRL